MTAAVVMALSPVAGLTGCSDSPQPVGAYVEPGWMAQVRQDVERYTSEMLACLDEFGVTGTVAIGGRVLTGGITDDKGNLPPGVRELQDKASAECNARVEPPSAWVAPADAAAYARMLDVRACLIAQGRELPEAPSEEAWIEQAATGLPWNPYQVLVDPEAPRIPDTELAALMQTCPQSGPGQVVYVPESAFG